MKIALLARNPNLYSHQRLIKAAEARGHQIDAINTLLAYMVMDREHLEIKYKGESLSGFDYVIPRIGASITFYGLAVLRQFELLGIPTLNKPQAIGRSRDKLSALQHLAASGISLPKTAFAHSTKYTKDLIQSVGGTPLIVKLLEGTQGIGVVLAETKRSAESLIDAFREVDANILVQEFIPDTHGSDIRTIVLGERVIASMMRQGGEGEFRSNLHRGGKAIAIEITEEERQAAVASVKALGLEFAGVDMIRSKVHGSQVIEVNSSPGLEGIETATGATIAEQVIEYMEQKLLNNV